MGKGGLLFNKENSKEYTLCKGKFLGACMVLEIDLEEVKEMIWLFSRRRRLILQYSKR